MSRVTMMHVLFVMVVVCGSTLGAPSSVKKALRTLPDSDDDDRAQEANDRRGQPLSDLQLLVPMVEVDEDGSPSQARAGSQPSDSTSSEEDERSSISLRKLVDLLSGPGSQVEVPFMSHTPDTGTLAAPRIIPDTADSEDSLLEVDVNDNDKTCPACSILQAFENQKVLEQLRYPVGNVQGWDRYVPLMEQADPRWDQKIPVLNQRGQRWDQKDQRNQEDQSRNVQNYVQRFTQLMDQQDKYWDDVDQKLNKEEQVRFLIQITDELERRTRRSNNAPDVGPPPESSVPQSRAPTP